MLFGSWVRRLFPEFAQRVNLVSGGNKSRVRDLYAALHEAASQANIRNRFFAIVDKDSAATIEVDTGASMFTWDSYHIEDYLLDPGSIREARKHFSWVQTRSTPIPRFLTHFETVLVKLVNSLVLERLQAEVNAEIVSAVEIGGSPSTTAPARDLLPSIVGSVERVSTVGRSLTLDKLSDKAEVHRTVLQDALESAEWLKEFPGHLVLGRFAGKYLSGKIDSLMFSNLVLDKMVERSVKPESMKVVLDQIAGV